MSWDPVRQSIAWLLERGDDDDASADPESQTVRGFEEMTTGGCTPFEKLFSFSLVLTIVHGSKYPLYQLKISFLLGTY